MALSKANIFTQLQADILRLQGFKSLPANLTIDMGLGPVRHAFPNAVFPLAAIHEFIPPPASNAAAPAGFIAGLLSHLMRNNGAAIWISQSRTLFPPALKAFGIDPGKIVFIDLQKERDILWTMEEALKCCGLSAVVGELKDLSFIASRRLQLAVEKSKVTGFVLRRNARPLNTTACVTRWQVSSLPSELMDELPGIGFPRWQVDLLKVRNGKPGSWEMEWNAGKFRLVPRIMLEQEVLKTKTG